MEDQRKPPVAQMAPDGPAVPGKPCRLAVLGSTGSVGESTLDLVAREPERFQVTALVANRNLDRLVEQALQFKPQLAVLADDSRYSELKSALAGTGIVAAGGRAAVIEAAAGPQDLVMAAIVGAAGLESTLAAVSQGTAVALANKECLVTAGSLFMDQAIHHGATILPVDSEHNAIFQAFESRNRNAVAKVTLTASGGPFRTWSRDQMAGVTPQQALRHPNWEMGAKITIDSATMMNKGLELIEAFHLFPIELEQLDILIHPQSIVHGLVSYKDGSVLAQLGTPDMRTPISYCLGWPHRMAAPSAPLDLAAAGQLTFEAPDPDRFPALRLAQEVAAQRNGATCVLNAANEISVQAFLDKRIGFLDISAIVERVVEAGDRAGVLREPANLNSALELDAWARRRTEALILENAKKAG